MTIASNGRASLAFAPRSAARAASILIPTNPSRDFDSFEMECAITTRSSSAGAAQTTSERATTRANVVQVSISLYKSL